MEGGLRLRAIFVTSLCARSFEGAKERYHEGGPADSANLTHYYLRLWIRVSLSRMR